MLKYRHTPAYSSLLISSLLKHIQANASLLQPIPAFSTYSEFKILFQESDDYRKVSDGLRKMSDGVKKVSDGSKKVSNGLGKLSDGLRRVCDCFERVLDCLGKFHIFF